MDVYEKSVAIPQYQWSSSFQPSFPFEVSDTASPYHVYVVMRHKDAYPHNNIWLNVGFRAPGDTISYQRMELILGNDISGWEGTGMDDIWELRKLITNGPIYFRKKGTYQFSVAHIMRENPLPGMMNIGIRVEKATK